MTQKKLLPEGDYTANLIAYGIRESRNGDAAPTAIFAIKQADGSTHSVYWQSSFNGDGMKHTMNALLTMGLDSVDKLELLADGEAGGALDLSREYRVTVEQKESFKDPSVLVNAVKWVNPAGGGAFKDLMSRGDFARQIASKNLKGALLRIADEKGIPLSAKDRNHRSQAHQVTPDELPF